MIKNLVFKGGGVKGTAYVGALKVLEDRGFLKGIERVAGTSAGAIVASLVALNYTTEGINILMNGLDYTNIQDGKNYTRMTTYYGIYRGDYFLQWIKTAVWAQTKNGLSTFADLRGQGFKDLHIVASELNTRGIKIFNADDTPDVIVAEAVRASMSIPFFFEAFTFSQGVDKKNVYADGGLAKNFPVQLFDDETINQETLGLCLWDYTGMKKSTPVEWNDPVEYGKIVFETIMNAQDATLTEIDKARSVLIEDYGISSTYFAITKPEKEKLYQAGVKYTADFIDIHFPNIN